MPHAPVPHVPFWKRFAVLTALLAVSACGAEQDVTVIKLGHALATDHPVHRAMEFMAERLAGGNVLVRCFAASWVSPEGVQMIH